MRRKASDGVGRSAKTLMRGGVWTRRPAPAELGAALAGSAHERIVKAGTTRPWPAPLCKLDAAELRPAGVRARRMANVE